MKVTIVPIVIGVLGTITKGLLKVLEELGRDYPDDSIAKNSQNTETSAGDLLSLKLLWKTIS